MPPIVSISKSGPGAKGISAALSRLARTDVLVGISQAKDQRKKEPVGNAALLYIHTNGSPAQNIPARPVIEPAIEADGNKQVIASELGDAAAAMLDDKPTVVTDHLRRAGIAGMNAAKSWFTDARNNWPPNTPETIRRKRSDRPLIDTGALKKAITYVVREET
jgi:hypothetical protein